jgi:hypothetical protein
MYEIIDALFLGSVREIPILNTQNKALTDLAWDQNKLGTGIAGSE